MPGMTEKKHVIASVLDFVEYKCGIGSLLKVIQGDRSHTKKIMSNGQCGQSILLSFDRKTYSDNFTLLFFSAGHPKAAEC